MGRMHSLAKDADAEAPSISSSDIKQALMRYIKKGGQIKYIPFGVGEHTDITWWTKSEDLSEKTKAKRVKKVKK